MNKINKVLTDFVQDISEENRVLRFVTSTENPDRDGDILEVSGWKVENYMKNPVVLFGHDYSSLPVGKTININIDIYKKKMYQDIQFATKEEYEFADTVYKMAKAGYLNTTSVGFMGIEHEPIFDENKNFIGRRYKKQELLETSIVPVPANPEALIEARTKGLIREEEMKLFMNKNVEKSGAMISAKNKEFLQGIHDEMHKAFETLGSCRDKLKEFMTPSMEEEAEEEEDPMMMKSCGDNSEKDIEQKGKDKSTDVSEINPDQNDENEIDIENMEDPDEINCTSEELEKAISNILDKKLIELKGGKTL